MVNTILRQQLATLYGESQADDLYLRLSRLLDIYGPRIPNSARMDSARFDESDAILITYGDMVQEPGRPPLRSLGDFLKSQVAEVISAIHLLPFYPYSSDDGFSVIDYREVDPDLGNWDEVSAIGDSFRLMFDAVINHASSQSRWFQEFLKGNPAYQDYFVVVEEGADLSKVFRPRALPLLTPVETPGGQKLVWTTFSADQVDLNFANPDVLFEIVEILLYYVSMGAEFIRLDAIAYLWKEPGTDSLHRPQTHTIIQFLRAVLDQLAPRVSLITETNVPHEENIAYFGDGDNEAQMVYNFSLPPLTLDAIRKGDAGLLTRWAATLDPPSDAVTYFNFLASHDGIGLMPARSLLADADIEALATAVQALGGYVSYKRNPDGTESAYELNINFMDALASPETLRPPASKEDPDLVVDRFLVSQAIMLALRGVPGIYFHSLFGSRSWHEGVKLTGRSRTINRQKLDRARLERELSDEGSIRGQVFSRYTSLLSSRIGNSAFHPNGNQLILDLDPSLFSLLRSSIDKRQQVLCLHNVSSKPIELSIDLSRLPVNGQQPLIDLIEDQKYAADAPGILKLVVQPYAILWLSQTTT